MGCAFSPLPAHRRGERGAASLGCIAGHGIKYFDSQRKPITQRRLKKRPAPHSAAACCDPSCQARSGQPAEAPRSSLRVRPKLCKAKTLQRLSDGPHPGPFEGAKNWGTRPGRIRRRRAAAWRLSWPSPFPSLQGAAPSGLVTACQAAQGGRAAVLDGMHGTEPSPGCSRCEACTGLQSVALTWRLII